jgi:hypothetical protein
VICPSGRAGRPGAGLAHLLARLLVVAGAGGLVALLRYRSVCIARHEAELLPTVPARVD